MTSKRFDPEKDLAPMPFDKRICRQALEMKKTGLEWRPQVGCFVWDPDEFIKPTSPFPDRIYFILSLARFIEIFDTVDQIAEKLVKDILAVAPDLVVTTCSGCLIQLRQHLANSSSTIKVRHLSQVLCETTK